MVEIEVQKFFEVSLYVYTLLACWAALATVMWASWRVAYIELKDTHLQACDHMQRHREAYGTMNYYKGLNEATEKFLEEVE
jgi:hypothetical protein